MASGFGASDDCASGSEPAVGGSPPPRRASGQRTPPNPRPAPKVSSGASVVGSGITPGAGDKGSEHGCDEDDVVCYLCVEKGDCSWRFRGVSFHRECNAAARAYGRLVAGRPDTRAACDAEFLQDPAAWRRRIIPLVAPPGERRSKSVRDAIRTRADEQGETISSKARLSRGMYVAVRSLLERMSDSEAEAAFFDDLEAQGSPHADSDEEPTVVLRGITLELPARALASATRVPEASSPLRSSLVGVVGGDRSDRKRKADEPGFMVDSPPASGVRSDGGRNVRARTKAGTARPLSTESILKAHGVVATSSSASVDASDSAKQVEMLRARSNLAREVRAVLDEAKNPRSAFKLLEKKMQGTTKDTLAALEQDPAELLAQAKTTVLTPLEDLHAAMGKLPTRDVAAMKVVVSALSQVFADSPRACEHEFRIPSQEGRT